MRIPGQELLKPKCVCEKMYPARAANDGLGHFKERSGFCAHLVHDQRQRHAYEKKEYRCRKSSKKLAGPKPRPGAIFRTNPSLDDVALQHDERRQTSHPV